MRLRASGDRHEIRQQYLPCIWTKTIGSLRDEGKDAVPSVINFLDSYYLTKDDFDSMLELGVGPMDQEHVKIESQTKATFTRMYNAQSHPMPFVKASTVGGLTKLGGAKKAKPDLEEAVDESDEEVIAIDAPEEQPQDDDEELDLKKDKYISAPKKKSAAKGGGAAKAKGKGKGKKPKNDDDHDDEDESEPDEPPKKKSKAKTKGKAKA